MDNHCCACALLTLTGLLACTLPAHAQPVHPPPAAIVEAEKVFWDCERLSAAHVLGAGDAAICSGAYEVLLRQKFRGDFPALMAWWSREKSASNLADGPRVPVGGCGTRPC
jgi:hypothetical protein